MKTTFLLLVVLAASMAFSQRVMPVADTSASGSPVALSGTLTFKPTEAILSVAGQNRSARGIMAILIQMDAPPLISFRSEHDHFFKAIEITPNSHFLVSGGAIQVPLGGNGLLNDKVVVNNGETAALEVKRVEAKAVWVQFEDGSTWGDEKEGAAMRSERVEIKAFLTHLLTVQKQSGDDAFLQELSAKQPRGSTTESMAVAFQHLIKIDGTAAMIQHVKDRLAIGASRADKQ